MLIYTSQRGVIMVFMQRQLFKSQNDRDGHRQAQRSVDCLSRD